MGNREEEILAMQGIGLENVTRKVYYTKQQVAKVDFLDSEEWKTIRKQRLEMDNHKCCDCGSSLDLTIDHVKAYWRYPKLRLDISNLQTLCWPCHQKKYRNGDTADLRKR